MTDDETWIEADHANTINTFDVGDTRTTHAITQTFPIDDGRAVEKHQNGTGIGDAGSPAYTLDRQQHASVAQPETMSVRRLTPIECERLMGWPDDWTAPEGIKAPDSKRYAACGDGIVSHVAYWIGCRIQMIEDES
jgi:site-specific DNA-cytosine methylase